jgi:mRNA interferase RelE/StbE
MKLVRSLSWKVELSPKALKALQKLDKSIAQKIWNELKEIETLDNPKDRGKALTGNLRGLWRYRVGNYRIVCDIINKRLIVLALAIGHRSSIYENEK